MKRIADDRKATVDTLEGAISLFKDLALQTLEKEITEATVDAAIAALKAECETTTANARKAIAGHVERLSQFILANKGMFIKPRKIKTPFGSFGLQKASELMVADESALLKWLEENGHEACIEREPRINKTAVKALLEAGTKIQGATIKSGDTAVYTISKTWLESSCTTYLEQEAARAKAG